MKQEVVCCMTLDCHAAGVALTQPLCLALLSVFETCGQSEQAEDVLHAASNAGIHLNVDLYNAVLRCCKVEQHGDRALQIWHDMEVWHLSCYMTDCRPNVVKE